MHLLVNEPRVGRLDRAIQALKFSVAVQSRARLFWQARYYDFNVFTKAKRIEKLQYTHRNPAVRGLVARPEDWAWSSFRHYATEVEGRVEIESDWTRKRRELWTLSSRKHPPCLKTEAWGTQIGESMRSETWATRPLLASVALAEFSSVSSSY